MIIENVYKNFSANEIKPSGWLLRQLEIQAEGLSGNLDKIWPDIKDSKWIGGNKDGWERVPYWLDGFIPLAYLLENEDMIARAKKYIDGILEGQKNDGWLCPCSDEERSRYDIWALFLILKVLVLYHDCSGDERIERAVYRALKNLKDHIRHCIIFNWASARWYECLISIYWLYERVKEDWLLSLAVTLYTQGMNYKNLFDNWYDQIPKREWSHQTHVVNLAMALKAEALISKITGKYGNSFCEKMINMLNEYHGTATGHFTGDECLAGTSPIQGTELCGVAEAMYSYEVLFSVTGEESWLDRLESLAYNNFPATTSADMWTHQYDQMTNQIACIRFDDKPIFGTNGTEAHLFGLEPNFGCCTANFNQAWPKFALSTFFMSKTGIVSASLAPARLCAKIGDTDVYVQLDTEYPFKNILSYSVFVSGDAEFDFDVRIPSCVEYAIVNGKKVSAGRFLKMRKVWSGTEHIEVELIFKTEFKKRPNDMTFLKRGPLIYSVSIDEEWKKIEYERDGVERKFPYCDYEIYPKSNWNYAFLNDTIEVEECGISSQPFSSENPPVKIYAEMAEIDWGMEDGYKNVCAAVPGSRKAVSDKKRIMLKPYGCTNLRMTEMPFLKEVAGSKKT